jgi:methylthioribose-1-phosphate isomerase
MLRAPRACARAIAEYCYLKELAAHDNGVPFFVALPSPTIDLSVRDGIGRIPIEQRGADEVATMTGRSPNAACGRPIAAR